MTSLSVNPLPFSARSFSKPSGLVVASQSGRQIDPIDVDVGRAAAKRAQRVAIGVIRQGADEHAERDLERLRGIDFLAIRLDLEDD